MDSSVTDYRTCPRLALGPGDRPGILYAVGSIGSVDVKYAQWNATAETWDIEVVDSGRAGKD